jgi:hypothetical protein
MYTRILWELIAEALRSAEHSLGTNGLDLGPRNFIWRGATPVIVGWFADRTWKNSSKLYT